MEWIPTESGKRLADFAKQPPTPTNNGALPKFQGSDDRGLYDLPDDWDYRNPVDNRGPNGDELPHGALAWTPHGEPYYGEGFTGVWNKIKSTWTQPSDEPLQWKDVVESTQSEATGLAQGIETATTFSDFLGTQLVQAPGGLKYAGRALVGTVQGIFGGFDQVGKYTERGLGAMAMTIDDLANVEGAPGQSYYENRLPLMEKLPPWLSWMEELNPYVLAWNLTRIAFTPKENYNNVGDVFKQNWEAARISYSMFHDNAIKGEYLRRFNAGDYQYPETLAMEMEIPSAELGGQLVLDPTNIIGYITKGLATAFKLGDAAGSISRFGSIADEYVHVSKALEEVIGNARFADDFEGAVDFARLATAQVDETKRVAQSLDDFSKSRKVWDLTQDGKQFHMTRRAGTLSGWIAQYSDNPDDVFEIFRALGDIASGDEMQTAAGLKHILNQPAPKPLLSRAGQELGILINRVTDNGDWAKYLDELDAIKAADKLPEEKVLDVVNWMNKKNNDMVEGMFPTIEEMIKRGDDVPAWQRGVAGLHNKIQNTGIYQFQRNMFSSIYMGMSPGYAFRNALTNNFQLVLDAGLDAYGHGTLFNPRRWVEKIRDWGVSMPSGISQGMGIHSQEVGQTIADVIGDRNWWSILKGDGKSEKFTQSFSRLSEYFEQRASMRVIGKAVDTAMRKMLVPGKALPDIRPLIDAGLSPGATDVLVDLVISNRGDIKKATNAFLDATKTGRLDLYSSMKWIDPGDKVLLQQFEIYDDIDAIAKGGGSLQEQLAKYEELYEQVLRKADDASLEHAGINPDHMPDGGESNQAMTASGYVSEDTINLSNNQAYANSDTMSEYHTAVNNAQREINNLIARAFKGDPEGNTAMLDRIDEISKGFKDFLNMELRTTARGADRGFLNNVWGWTEEIRGMKSPTVEQLTEKWNEIGIALDPPANLDKQLLLNTLWDGYFRPERKAFWEAIRDITASRAEQFMGALGNELAELGIDTSKYLTEARKRLAHAQSLDTAFMDTDNKMYRLSHMLRGNMLREGGEPKAIRILAFQYGINTATKRGVGFDTYLMNTIKKYGDNITTNLLDEVSIDEAWVALENMRASKNQGSVIEDLDLLLGRIRRQVDQAVDETPEQVLQRLGVQRVDDIPEGTAKYLDTVGKGEIANLNDIDIGAIDDPEIRAQITDLIRDARNDAVSTDARVRARVDGLVEEINGTLDSFYKRTVDETPEQVLERLGVEYVGETNGNPLIPPYDGRTTSQARVMTESMEQITGTFNRLIHKAKQNFGKGESASFSDNINAALSKWTDEGTGRIEEARLMAQAYGNEARAFTLHDYPAKRNFDLATSYVMPYNFWYSRTYSKWFTQRIWRNPGTIAAYAKYKSAMAKLHAGAPEWWKYNVNTNELLGMDSDHPLFFNLEATLNPLNGMLGVDFDDPYKRVDHWTSTLDSIGRFGPSVWTPISLMTAAMLYRKGESNTVGEWEGQDVTSEDYKEAAGRWAGRLIPQTATIKSLTGLLNIAPGGVELDPSTLLFSGGTDPYERRRIGRALASMVEDGVITEAQANDAAYVEDGEVWDMAKTRAVHLRGWGQLSSFFMGVGFKSRNPEDMQIDRFYQAYNMLWRKEPDMSPEDFRTAMSDLRNEYPFMDSILISKRGGFSRDRAFSYNVLSRIPPGQSGDIAEVVGINQELLSKFYDTKGHIELWPQSDRQRFIAGIVDIGALLDLPDNATQAEWDDARNAYSRMKKQAERQFGDDIWDKVDVFYQMNGETQSERDAAKRFLDKNPVVTQAMNWQTDQILNDPQMQAYYGGIDKVANYYRGMMYDEIDEKLGNVNALWDEYYFLKDTGGNYRQFYRENEATFDEYRDIKDEWEERIAQEMVDFASNLNEAKPAWYRQDSAVDTVGTRQLYENLEQPTSPYYSFTQDQWKITLGTSTAAVLSRGTIPEGAEGYLTDIAEGMNLTLDELVDIVSQAPR